VHQPGEAPGGIGVWEGRTRGVPGAAQEGAEEPAGAADVSRPQAEGDDFIPGQRLSRGHPWYTRSPRDAPVGCRARPGGGGATSVSVAARNAASASLATHMKLSDLAPPVPEPPGAPLLLPSLRLWRGLAPGRPPVWQCLLRLGRRPQ